MKKFDISDIRNKLNPVVNLVAMIENGLVKGKIEIHDLVLQEIEQVKNSVKYLTTDEKPKYNQKLIEKVRNRDIVIEVDGFEGIKDLIDYIYPGDQFLVDEFLHKRKFYFTTYKEKNKVFWASNIAIHEDMKGKPRIKASEFIVK